MTHVLVTGGAGFIGRHLCRALVARGDRVTVLDDLSSGDAEALPSVVDVIRADVCDGAAMAEAVAGADAVIHLAAISSVEACSKDRERTRRINLGGAESVAKAAEGRPVVFTSSAAVYGDQPILPVTETMPLSPISPYAEDKVAAERCLTGADAPVVILRPFNVYGPEQMASSPYSGVISRFVERAEAGLPLRINGDGAQTRDFIEVGDVARALMAALDHCQATRPASAIANVCSGAALPILELAQAINRLAGSTASVDFGPPRIGDIRHSLGDPSVAERLLGFAARVPMGQGLATLMGRDQTAALTDSSK